MFVEIWINRHTQINADLTTFQQTYNNNDNNNDSLNKNI